MPTKPNAPFVPLNIAVLTVSDTRTEDTDTSGAFLCNALLEAGHKMADKRIVIDDIYWSEDMNEAWKEIISDDSVAFSIDLFRMGIVFFDHSVMPKQHFKLIPYKLKPWSIGLFG